MTTATLGDLNGLGQDTLEYTPSDDWVLPVCRMGIEVEAEGFRREIDHTNFDPYWSIVPDGSLRDSGLEFVLARPLFGKDLTGAINQLSNNLPKYNPVYSDRTSVHVHLDVRDLTPLELFRLLTLYLVFERVLFDWVDPDGVRKNNNYCIPVWYSRVSAEKLYFALAKNTLDRQVISGLNRWSKYCALNLLSVNNLGSLEFRHMPGTHNADTISKWVNIIMCLKRAAKEGQYHPDTIPDNMSQSGPEGFLNEVFSDLIPSDIPRLEVNILKGARSAQDCLHAYHLYQRSMFDVNGGTHVKRSVIDFIVEKFGDHVLVGNNNEVNLEDDDGDYEDEDDEEEFEPVIGVRAEEGVPPQDGRGEINRANIYVREFAQNFRVQVDAGVPPDNLH